MVMIAVKDGWVLRRTGLIGSCAVYANSPDGSQQERCRAGSLDGHPDLSGKGCTKNGVIAGYQYWLCPAAVASKPGGF